LSFDSVEIQCRIGLSFIDSGKQARRTPRSRGATAGSASDG
jgi:hypothetical protein